MDPVEAANPINGKEFLIPLAGEADTNPQRNRGGNTSPRLRCGLVCNVSSSTVCGISTARDQFKNRVEAKEGERPGRCG